MAAVLGKHVSGLERDFAPLLDEKYIRRIGKRGKVYWFAPEFIAKWAKKTYSASPTSTDGDEVEGGSDSPALERLRTAKADREEIRLAEDRREVIHRQQAMETFNILSSVFRRRVDQLQRKYGREAADWFLECLEEADRVLLERFAGDSADGVSEDDD